MSAHREHALQQTCSVYLARALPITATWTSVDPATDQKMSVVAGARRKARGCRPGWPDLQIIWCGQFYGIELKIDNGKQSESQSMMQEEIERAGGKYSICRSVDEVERQLVAWGIPLRAHTMAAHEYDDHRDARLSAPPKAPRPPRANPATKRGLKIAAWAQRPPER